MTDQVAVVTVTYSPGEHLHRFLRTLRHATDRPLRVILADNGSTDGAPEAAAEEPDVELLRTGGNVGYGKAANLGVAQVDPAAEWIVIANPDVQWGPGSIDALLEELIALHARPLPPDTTDPEQLARFDPLLGVQVRRPAFKPFGASFNGARVHPVSDRGALLQVQYTVPDGKRITMYVFNPRVLPVQATRLEPRVVRHRPMLVGRLRGYSVAALEQSGVGYAFASDLDTDESTKMVLAALPQ